MYFHSARLALLNLDNFDKAKPYLDSLFKYDDGTDDIVEIAQELIAEEKNKVAHKVLNRLIALDKKLKSDKTISALLLECES